MNYDGRQMLGETDDEAKEREARERARREEEEERAKSTPQGKSPLP